MKTWVYLHIGSFDLRSDSFGLDEFGRRAAAGSSGQGGGQRWRRWFGGDLLLEEVHAEAQSHIRRRVPLPELRHASGELLHARVQVREDGEIDFGLQAGRGADGDAGTFALDAQVGLLQVQDLVVLVILGDGAKTSLPRFPLQRRLQNIRPCKLHLLIQPKNMSS